MMLPVSGAFPLPDDGVRDFLERAVVNLALFELDVKLLEKKFTEVRDHL